MISEGPVGLKEEIAEIVDVMNAMTSHDQIEGVARQHEIVTINSPTMKNDPSRCIPLEGDAA